MFKIQQIDHVAITVNDIQQSIDWYCNILGGKIIFDDKWDGEPVFIQLGTSCIALFLCSSDKKSNAGHDKVNIMHFAFKTDAENFKEAQKTLREKNIFFRFEDHEVCHSIYFQDQDGHQLEITTYEID